MEIQDRRSNTRRSALQIGTRRQSYGRRPLEMMAHLDFISFDWEEQGPASWRKSFGTNSMVILYVAVAALLLISAKTLHQNVLSKQVTHRMSLSASYQWAGFHRVGPFHP